VPTAVKYYGLAAEQGWSEAMNNLAKAYETGFGIGRDPVQALKWYLLASARATEDEQMVAANMQTLLRGMSMAEIEKGAALAREWEGARRK
jgi:TPR repeat protein